jgi:predicted glycoside hydrolase/deacetylase ChbG (UPF0249 family)
MLTRRFTASALRCVMVLVLFSPLARAQKKSVAERLGYPADAKLLIIHADDLAVAHSVDRASFAALNEKAVSSASIMVPCAWLTEVAEYAKLHPDADLGLHLTLTSEWKVYKWGPVAWRDQVPSLLDANDYFWPDVQPAVAHAKPEEVERELRAQIELAKKMGIEPTHVDSHMGTLFQTPDLVGVYVKVAREYHLPFLALRIPNLPPEILAKFRDDDIVLDSVAIMSPGVAPEHWTEWYLNALKNLKPGLNELIVHLGHDDAELQGVSLDHPDYGAAWRERDFRTMTSPEFKKALEDNHIIVIGWKDLKKLTQ